MVNDHLLTYLTAYVNNYRMLPILVTAFMCSYVAEADKISKVQKAPANVSQELVGIIQVVVEEYFHGINHVDGWSEEARKGAGTGICSDIAKPMRIQVEVGHHGPVSV